MGNPFAVDDVGLVYERGRPFHHPEAVRHVLALVGAAVGRVLDVACGTGMSAVAMAEVAGRVTGLDAEPAMLAAARRHPRVDYALAAAERLPVATAAIDGLNVSSAVHWFDQDAFLAEAARVVRPGGWLALCDHYFLAECEGEPAFRDWMAGPFLERWPMVPRARREVGEPHGFVAIGDERYPSSWRFDHDGLVAYLLTQSNVVDTGEAARDFLTDGTAPLFAAGGPRTFRFLGTVACYRRCAP